MSNKNRNGHAVNPNRPTEVDIAAKVRAGLGTKDDAAKVKEAEKANDPEVKAKAEKDSLAAFVAAWEATRVSDAASWFTLSKACGSYFNAALRLSGRGDKDTFAGVTSALIARLGGSDATKGTVSRLLGSYGVMIVASDAEGVGAGEVEAAAKTCGRAYWQQLVRLVQRDPGVGSLLYKVRDKVDASDVLELLTEASKGAYTVQQVKDAIDELLEKGPPEAKSPGKIADGIVRTLAGAKDRRTAVIRELAGKLTETDYIGLAASSPECRAVNLMSASRGELTAAIERLDAIADAEAANAALKAANERMTNVHAATGDMLDALGSALSARQTATVAA